MRYLLPALIAILFLVHVSRTCVAQASPGVTIAGEAAPQYAPLDAIVATYMQAHQIPNGELAVWAHGATVFSHAYTNGAVNATAASPATIFRLASNSKAWTSAAIDELLAAKMLTGNERVFAYLDIRDPLPEGSPVVDPRVHDITVRELVDHTAGWDRAASGFDPMHAMRRIALDANLGRPARAPDIARYMLSQPLQHAPGTTYAYCNVCYLLLGMVVEKASGESFLDFVDRHVAQPLGVTDLQISPTADPRLPTEVGAYASNETGLNPLLIDSQVPVAGPNGGDGEIREVAEASGGLATSAESMLKLMERYAVWGLGGPPRAGSLAREGAAAGTESYARQRKDGVHYAIVFNKDDGRDFRDLHERLDQALDTLGR